MADRITPLLDATKDLSNLFDLKGKWHSFLAERAVSAKRFPGASRRRAPPLSSPAAKRDKADELAAALEKAGHRAGAAAFDATDVGEIRRAVDQVAKPSSAASTSS